MEAISMLSELLRGLVQECIHVSFAGQGLLCVAHPSILSSVPPASQTMHNEVATSVEGGVLLQWRPELASP